MKLNQGAANSKFMKNDVIDGLDEMEDLEDLDMGGKGFQFYDNSQQQKQPQAGPTLVTKQSLGGGFAQNKKHSPPALALGTASGVNSITNVVGGGHGRKSSSYGKKIGFDDDFDDDWDDTDRNDNQLPKNKDDESEDWDDDYGL